MKATNTIKTMKRYLHIPKRIYDMGSIDKFRPPIPVQYASSTQAEKLRDIVTTNFKNKTASITYGCTDPCMVSHMNKHLDTIYVSGWQTASLSATDSGVGPDFADYPHDSVSKLVNRLFKAQLFHATKHKSKTNNISPIIADADTGHGGITSMMRMTRNFIESGVGGIHIEDQKHGVKKCGHMGGKVLCSTREHIVRLNSARLQADIMGVPLFIIARTDAVDAKYIDTDIDTRDHKHIKGHCQDGNIRTLREEISKRLVEKGQNEEKYSFDKVMKDNFMSFEEIKNYGTQLLGESFYWDHSHPNARSSDGFYSIQGSDTFAMERAIHFGEYSDSVWIETSTPSQKQARLHSSAIHNKLSSLPLSYNNSPSFNWDAANMNDTEIREWTDNLGKMGYAWQFITLAGIHNIALNTDKFAKSFSKEGMLSYVRNIQREERVNHLEMLTHQKWSGANMSEEIQGLLGENDTSSCGTESTENQF
tara:strand:+ start:2135 stop:3568 length:1434 start_codon:yes stop_codon:yes gene_type:complete